MNNIINNFEDYNSKLELAKDYFSKKKKQASGSKLPINRIDFLISQKAQCPYCSILLTGGNHNTEHIHPLSLGGVNTLSNKIQICVSCNHAQNQIMQSVVGKTPYKNHYPDNWEGIKNFLLWSEITADHGINISKKYFPDIYELFCDFKFQPRNFIFPVPRKFYGRASTWSIGDKAQSFSEKNPIISTNKKIGKKPFWVKIGDFFFGDPKQEPKQKPKQEPKRRGSKEEFSDLIISLIGKETISSTELASKIKQYQIENSWEKTGKRPLLSYFSFNSGKTYKQILESHMSDKVEILGEQPNYQFRLLKQGPKPDPKPQENQISEIPEVEILEKSTKCRDLFPHESNHLIEICYWLNKNLPFNESTPHKLLLDKLRDSLSVGKRTLNHAISGDMGIASILFPEIKKISQLDWNTLQEKPDWILLCETFVHNLNPKEIEYINKVKREIFKKLIIDLIGDEKISTNSLSAKVRAFQMSNNWEETGTRALCLRFNFPLRKKVSRGKTSLKDLISNNLDEEVEIFLEDTMHYYKLK